RRPCSGRPFAAATAAYSQFLLPVKPEELLMVHDIALAFEQDMQAPVTEAPALPRKLGHPLPKSAIGGTRGVIANGHAAAADGFTRPPFAHPMIRYELSDSFPLGSGRYHFFPRRSFRAALSSIASASIRLSLVFSSSSARSRLASDTSMPPYFAFHL